MGAQEGLSRQGVVGKVQRKALEDPVTVGLLGPAVVRKHSAWFYHQLLSLLSSELQGRREKVKYHKPLAVPGPSAWLSNHHQS